MTGFATCAAMSTLFDAAQSCLDCTDPARKVQLTQQACTALAQGRLALDDRVDRPHPAEIPGRPQRPALVDPRQLARRGLGTEAGRAALVHAVAHIEFNAINLAWDAVARFRDMPADFYRDWAHCADDEARHFSLLVRRLAELGMAYGDLPAHDGLWSMAQRTRHSVLARMALVPRVLEARGLDVTPGMIERLRAVGDQATVAILELILREEVPHVAAGTRWFRWCCAHEGLEPEATFHALLDEYLPGGLRGPFNLEARRAAGFSDAELDALPD